MDSNEFLERGRFDLINFDNLCSHFDIVNYTCGGVDGLICKVHLIAKQPGQIDDPLLNIPIIIKPTGNKDSFLRRKSNVSASYNDDGAGGELVHEVKRVGFLIDRFVDL